MLCRTHPHRLYVTLAAGVVLAAAAPAAPAMPIDGPIRSQDAAPAPEPVRVVRVQVDEGLDWGDAGMGAAGTLALVLVGFGGTRVFGAVPSDERSAAHS